MESPARLDITPRSAMYNKSDFGDAADGVAIKRYWDPQIIFTVRNRSQCRDERKGRWKLFRRPFLCSRRIRNASALERMADLACLFALLFSDGV